MESFRGTFAVLLCCTLCAPAPFGFAQSAPASPAQPDQAANKPSHRAAYQSGQLQGDERILHALNRFTFGPRPGDLEAVRAMGLEAWFNQQLHPATLDETDLDGRLAQFPAMQWSTQDLIFRIPSNAIIRQAIAGKVPVPESGTLHAVYENQIYRLQAKKAEQDQKKATAQADQALAQPANGGQSPAPAPAMAMDTAAAAPAPAMTQPQNQPAAQPAAMDSMTAATVDLLSQPDQSLITSVLALPPKRRVVRLQSMQPADFDAFLKSLKPAQRKALTGDLTPDLVEAVDDLENPQQLLGKELMAQRLTCDIYSNAQFQEVMTDFWLNHFNVYLRKNDETPYYLVSYERDVIRPLALGRFEDLLEAVAHSPAMLLYLDNASSMGPDSQAAERAKLNAARNPSKNPKAPEGLNENYARELMELHTLGVNGGYTQADVTQVARVLTGWTVDRQQRGGDFVFNPNRHEPGTKKVLGQKIKENGEMEGRELLHMLATRPATAHFISRELAIRFVSDDPPQTLVDRMAKSYLASSGDMTQVMKTLFHSPEFWAASDYRAKVKTPIEFIVSAARAGNADVENFQPLVNALRQMGMPLYGCVPPTGYKWEAAEWVSTGSLVDRMNLALNLAANRLPGITVTWLPQSDDTNTAAGSQTPSPEAEEARLEPLLVAGGVSETTRSAALQQFEAQAAQNSVSVFPVSTTGRPVNRGNAANALERQDQLLAGLLIGSPEFQRR
jgi:uncharacterized protein (DUF1800 family)